MSTNEIIIDGERLDLDIETVILPSFQANELTQPDKINSDFTPEFSVPFTTRNHRLLGQAAYGTSGGTRAYRRTMATVVSNGVETMPRALLQVKGAEGGRYQLQAFAGNKRFAEALGDKKLADLDLSRFDHRWSFDEVAARLSPEYYAAHGWSYELFERGKPLDLAAVLFTDCYPSLSAGLIWQQMLAEAGFRASDWGSPVLDRLKLPATRIAEYSEAWRKARTLVASIGPGYEDGPHRPQQDRATVWVQVPYTDVTRRPNYQAPTVPGIYSIGGGRLPAYVPDEAVYLDGSASATVQLLFSTIRLGKAAARLAVFVNDVQVTEGPEITADNETPFVVSVPIDGLLLGKDDRLTVKMRLRGVDSLFGDQRWGYHIFRDAFYQVNGTTLPPDKLQLTPRPMVPPGGMVRLVDWLPDMTQLAFFKALVQVGGLLVQTDGYEDYLRLTPTRQTVANVGRALDWTAKRDQPSPQASLPRTVAFRFGSYAQRNYFKWQPDETATLGYQGAPLTRDAVLGYGDGVLAVGDTTLPAEYTLTTLPFAATEPSTTVPGLLRLPSYKLRFDEDPFAAPVYESQELKPRLVLHTPDSRSLMLRAGPLPAPLTGNPDQATQDRYNAALALYNRAQELATPLSYFADPAQEVELDAQRYLLPVCWLSLRAMLTETRYLSERYRLTELDIIGLDYAIPIWDAHLGDYFVLSRVSEFDASRPTEVQLVRLHASLLPPPTVTAGGQGQEYFEGEFLTAPPIEFY